MKNSMKILLAATVLSGAGFFASVPVAAQPMGFSFRIGDVAIAYDDGYYVRYNRWHRWRHNRERAWYRMHHRASYRAMRHDRDRDGIPDRFDRDRDNDGVPNRFDRDRDNDGVPNRYDARPNNPYRR